MTEKYAELKDRLVVGRKRDGRCVYDEVAKEELVVACLRQGVSVARMAMQHGVNTNLVRTWIAAYQRRISQVSSGDIAQMQNAFIAVHAQAKQEQTQPAAQRECAMMPAVTHPGATAVALIADKTSLAPATVGLQVRLPNGVQFDLGETSLRDLPTLVQMLSRLPCSA